VVLALLLVPVRYRIDAVKKGDTAEAGIRLSWLLHLVSISVSAGIGKKLSILIRVAGICLPLFDGKQEQPDGRGRQKGSHRRTQTRNKSRSKRSKRQSRTDDRKPRKTTRSQEEDQKKKVSGTERIQDKDVFPESDTVTCVPEKQDIMETFRQKEPVSQSDMASDFESNPEPSAEPDSPARSWRSRLQSILSRIRAFGSRIRAVWEWICRLAAAIAHVPAKIRHFGIQLRKRLERLATHVRRMLERPAELMDFMEEYEVLEVAGTLKKELQYLFRHYEPRRIHGYLEFGTGDPAQTGQLTGVIYLLLPARAEEFEIRPDFYDTRLETEVACAGHIRAVHLVYVALNVLKDQKIQRLIRRFTRKGE
jgi:hypothetical protein